MKYLEEVNASDFELNRPTFSDFSVLAILYFLDDAFSKAVSDITRGFGQSQPLTTSARRKQVDVIHKLCKKALNNGYPLHETYTCHATGLAYFFFCTEYC